MKSKTQYSEWESYNLNALYSILESSRLIFSKWKRLKVRVDGWVVAEPPVVNGDEWDDHQQSQSDNLRRNGGWWGKSQAFQCQAIYTYVCLVQLSLLPNHIDVQLHTLYKITRNRAELHYEVHTRVETAKKIDCLPALHHSTFLESSIINLPPIFHLL